MSALDKQPALEGYVAPVFISIDAQRDTVGALREYLREFDSRIVGLTGTPEQLKHMSQQFRIHAFRSGDSSDLTNMDYLVDHSIFFLLLNPDGKFVDYYGPKQPVDEIVDRVLFHIQDFQDNVADAKLKDKQML